MSPFQPGAPRTSPDEKPPVGLAGQVGHAARQAPPPPKGKGLVIALIAGAAVVGALYQFATGSGPGKSVREQRARDAKEAEEAGTRKTDLRAPAEPVHTNRIPDPVPGRDLLPDPAPPPEVRIALPPGLGSETAANLRLALGAIESGYTVGATDLPRLVAAAEERERPIVRHVVVETLTRLAARKSTRGLALDAALELTADGRGGLESIVAVATAGIQAGDETAAEALVFFEHLPAAEGKAAVKAVTALLEEDLRQLHLRVMAARVLVGWNAAAEARKALAAKATTPVVLRNALGAE